MKTDTDADQRQDIIRLATELQGLLERTREWAARETSQPELDRIGKALDYVERELEYLLYRD